MCTNIQQAQTDANVRQARCRPKERKQVRLAREREARMVLQQERAKRRPRSDHEYAIPVNLVMC
jgi:uncharacterized protein YqfA (UPF0365 family)